VARPNPDEAPVTTTFPFLNVFLPSTDFVTVGLEVAAVWARIARFLKLCSLLNLNEEDPCSDLIWSVMEAPKRLESLKDDEEAFNFASLRTEKAEETKEAA
jgi:hypothetical protein